MAQDSRSLFDTGRLRTSLLQARSCLCEEAVEYGGGQYGTAGDGTCETQDRSRIAYRLPGPVITAFVRGKLDSATM